MLLIFYRILFLYHLFIYGCAGSLLLHRLFSSCGYSLVAVCSLLTEVASLVAKHMI